MTLPPEVLSGLRERLEPCPFCGGAVELTSSKTLGDRLFCIKCPDDSPCVGSGLGIYVVAGQVETAIAAWNRRAALDLSPPVVEEDAAWLADRVDALADAVEERYGGLRVTFGHGGVGRNGGSLSVKEVCDGYAALLRSTTASPSKPEEGADHIAGVGKMVPVPEPQAVAWRIDTDDQVELLAKECGINNRRYMTPKDYSIWCEQQRQFARLAAAPLSGGGKVEVTNGVVDAQWQWLCDKDDRSSPVEYPDMALVTRDELGEIIVAVLSTMGGKP